MTSRENRGEIEVSEQDKLEKGLFSYVGRLAEY